MNKAKTPKRRMMRAATSLTAIALWSTGAFAQDTIKMGGIMSMTGGGASIGVVADNAWRMAIDEINEAGGILGKKVEYVLADTMTDPTHGVSETRRLIENEGIQILVGPATSQETMGITAVTSEKKIVQLSTAASTDLTPAFAPYHFTSSVTGLNQMKANVDYAIDVLGLKKLALISDNGGMSKAAVTEIVAYMTERGNEPVIVQEFPFRTEDMTPQLLSMRSSGAEAVLLINSIGDDSRKFLENRADIGWEAPVLASMTTQNYAVGNARLLGDDAFNDVYATQFVGMTFCPGDAVGESAFAKFAERARARIPNIDQMGGPSALNPYFMLPMVAAAAANGAGSTDGDAMKAWLETKAGEIVVMQGAVNASPESHFLPAVESVVVVRNPHKPREDGLVERAVCN
ncbi:ABC transporter substrate-binding protein [Pontitalea aquivivens]|uniref:ABC transporter substrate-binding protein n=1 Tax=Pontitalea aquivivens TaxID=3388663 RepID=UPI003970DE0F